MSTGTKPRWLDDDLPDDFFADYYAVFEEEEDGLKEPWTPHPFVFDTDDEVFSTGAHLSVVAPQSSQLKKTGFQIRLKCRRICTLRS